MSASSKVIQLTWQPGYDGNLEITEYVIELQVEKIREEYRVYKSNMYTISTLNPGTKYMIRVKAKNSLGFSEYSDVTAMYTEEEGL